jgi:hypothetical protein
MLSGFTNRVLPPDSYAVIIKRLFSKKDEEKVSANTDNPMKKT